MARVASTYKLSPHAGLSTTTADGSAISVDFDAKGLYKTDDVEEQMALDKLVSNPDHPLKLATTKEP